MLLEDSLNLQKTLARNYVFRGLPDRVLSVIAGLSVNHSFEAGEVIVRRFGKGTNLYVVLEGTAEIESPAGVLAEFGPGSVIGEISLVDGQTRSATVVARDTVTTALIPIEALRGVIEMDASIGLTIMTNIAEVLCRRLRHMNQHLDAIAPSCA